MELAEFRGGPYWSVWVEVDKTGSCPFLDYLVELKRDDPDSYKAVLTRIGLMADHNLRGNKDVCHDVIKKPHVFQWTCGDARILWFYGKNKRVILAHWYKKQKQRLPKQHRKAAIAFHTRWSNA